MLAIWLLTSVATTADPAVQAAPPPVRRFIERRESCEHWSGEEGYDATRARDIAAALRSGRCDRIETDERALRRRYARQRDVLDLLARTAGRGF